MADDAAVGEVADAVDAVDEGDDELKREEGKAPEGEAVVGVKE